MSLNNNFLKSMTININPEELKKMYYENTVKKTAKHFKISTTTVTKLIKEQGFPLKGRGKRRQVFVG